MDSAGALPDGHAFKDVREFKQLLLEHQELTVARNLVDQLATYATDAPIGFRDGKQVDEILEQTRASGEAPDSRALTPLRLPTPAAGRISRCWMY